jgi:alpha-L-rhamnosidase
LTSAHAQGAAVQGLGTGIAFAPALASATPQGATVSNSGTGVNITPALPAAAAAGATIARADQPADYCRPPGSFSNSGSCRAILPNYMLRKAFTVDPVLAHGAVVSARVYSTGLGWNDMTVNGSKTEPNTWMNPGFTAYDQTVLYTTDDVTALIQQDAAKPKTNVVATQLAAGRYNSTNSTGGHAFEFAQWRAQEVLRADLYVKYADGTEQLVKTDPSWQVSIDGPVRVSDYFDGETFDARKQMPGWNTASYDASKWASVSVIAGPKGRVYAQPQESSQLVRAIPNKVNGVDTFPMWQVSDGVYGVDTLQERQGQPIVSIWGAAAGQVIRVVAVERRNDDGLPTTTTNRQDGAFALPGGMSQQYYISNGAGTAEHPEVFAPTSNVQGFQWVQIAGPNGEALPPSVHVHVDAVWEMRTNMPQTGIFTSSNTLLNKIHEGTRVGVAVNHTVGQITDTPTYERDGWTGDSQLMAPSASYLFNTQRQFLKSAQDAVDSQVIGNTYVVNSDVPKPRALGAVGLLIPSAYGYGYCSPVATDPYGCGNSTPSNSFGKGANNGATPIWDSFLHVLPYEAYRFFGDTRPAATAYAAMSQYLKSWATYWMGAYTANIDSTKHYLVSSGLGDWAAPRGNPGSAVAPPGGVSDDDQAVLDNTNFSVGTIGVPSGSAYLAYMAKVTAAVAAALGNTADEAYFKTMFENIRKDYNAKWYDASVGYYRESPSQPFLQSMQAIPLGMGIVDEANRIPLETKLVQDVLVIRHGHEEVGIAGSRWIFPALTQAAHDGVPDAAKAAYTIALQTTYPSYGYWIQTLGWTGIGEYWEAGSRTRTHEMYGSSSSGCTKNLPAFRPPAPASKP